MLYDPDRTWEARGVCRPEDDHLFFAGGDGHKPGPGTVDAWRQAKEICAMCPVFTECRRDTLGEIHGVWGGLDPLERRVARKKFATALMEGSEEERLAWAKEIHALREAGAKWADIQQKTGVPVGTCERLWGIWDSRVQEQGVKGQVVDLPLPELGSGKKSFPVRPGRRHAWVRHNGLVSDAWYRGETPDGALINVTTEAGRGQVHKWVPAEDVKMYRPQAAVVLSYPLKQRKEAADAAA